MSFCLFLFIPKSVIIKRDIWNRNRVDCLEVGTGVSETAYRLVPLVPVVEQALIL